MLDKPVRPFLLIWFSLAFCFSVHCQDIVFPFYLEQERAEPKTLEIKHVKLFAWQVVNKERNPVEVQEFREAKQRRLIPSNTFDLECEIVGGEDVLAGDYFLWTTVDFLVAPITREYEQMDTTALSSTVGWGQMAEMRDLRATPIYDLRPDESRQVVVKDLDLDPVLAAFPVGKMGSCGRG